MHGKRQMQVSWNRDRCRRYAFPHRFTCCCRSIPARPEPPGKCAATLTTATRSGPPGSPPPLTTGEISMMPTAHELPGLACDDIAARALLDMLFPPVGGLPARPARRRAARPARDEAAAARECPFDARLCPDHVAVIDRPSPGSITVTWSDPRFGKHSEQIWHTALSHGPAVCALTGREIPRGSRVFRPRKRDANEPADYPWMILSSVIDAGIELPIANATCRRQAGALLGQAR
ncbi:DUF3331 domain-containing protein [Burkholderia gladioli]|nr:DUF3331 domain-containing protein [Burkholderia gladioli]NBI45071.1 DUF3331 domain-containing protein [Burkholderia sp. ISTR5]